MEDKNPPTHSGPILYLLDVRNGVERRHLRRTLLEEPSPAGSQASELALPISDERRTDTAARLATCLSADPDTLLIPARVAWRIPNFETDRGLRLRHLLLGDPRRPRSLRAWFILLRNARRGQCITGKPATIREMRERFDGREQTIEGDRDLAFARFVLRQASLVLDIAERDVRGSRYKVPRYVAEAMKSRPKFRAGLKAIAEENGKAEASLESEVDKYMDELISRPRAIFIDLKARMERFLFSLGYEGEPTVDPAEVERLRAIIREKPTLLLFTHKTYLDGMSATYIAYRNDMPLIHTFGGINMAMPVMSTIMRGSGGIFIRRSFKDNPVYKHTLRHYISYLLEKRFPMTWAFEGTRSRIGKLMPPRFGLLKYVIDAAHSNNIEDLHFVPVSTSFDLIRDVEDYVGEQTGRVKKPETLGWFLGYVRSLRVPRGRVYVNFGEPVIVHRAPDPDDSLALSKIAFEVAVRANRVTPFTPNALICMTLLGVAPRGLTASELRQGLNYFINWGRERGVPLSPGLENMDLEGAEHVAQVLRNSGLFLRYDKGSETVYQVEPGKHPMASYYRNTIIHHFLDRAIIELSLLKAREQSRQPAADAFWEECYRLRDLFKFEFFYPEKDEFRANLEMELGRVEPDWQLRLAEGGDALVALHNRFQPLMGHAVLLQYAEAYTIVLDILCGLKPGDAIDRSICVDAAIREGKVAYMLRRITSEASIAKLLFENGFSLAEHMGLAGETNAESLAARKALLREFRALTRRMEQSRLEGLRFVERVFEDDDWGSRFIAKLG